nr:exodeoxyribonuclease VII small subunit [Edaphobacter aggregans]
MPRLASVGGDLPLEESLRLFEEGVRLLNACKRQLEDAEGRIQVLVEDGSGEVRVAELEVEEQEEEEQG